jgi:hypothetical protein
VVVYLRRLGTTIGRRRAIQLAVAAWFVGMVGWGTVEAFVEARHYPRRAVMAAVAQRIGPERELGLVQWRDGQWLFAQNPIVHFGYRGTDQVGQALTWLRGGPDRWLIASDRWLASCFDMSRAVHVGEDRDRNLFLVDASMDPGRCPPAPIRRFYRFRWMRSYW